MTKPFKPMLAAEADLSTLKFPLIVSPKLDGVRALIKDGQVLSRSLKPIRNVHVQDSFGKHELEGLDGELIVGQPTDSDVYRNTQSVVNSSSKETPVFFYVFDAWDHSGPFMHRWGPVEGERWSPKVYCLQQKYIENMDQLLAFEKDCLYKGFEGVILRDPQSPYKFGRSTTKEGYLLKLKRFQDSEACVLAVEELMHNGNEATTNELGRTARSTHKENLVGMGTMGALLVEDIHTGQVFRIGTGFSAEERAWWWERRHTGTYDGMGLIIKYKFFPVGVKELPRHPVYLGLRDESDMGGE